MTILTKSRKVIKYVREEKIYDTPQGKHCWLVQEAGKPAWLQIGNPNYPTGVQVSNFNLDVPHAVGILMGEEQVFCVQPIFAVEGLTDLIAKAGLKPYEITDDLEKEFQPELWHGYHNMK